MSQTWLILPAAGEGRRCGGSQPKQLWQVHGRSILAHALAAFRGLIDGCIIATRDELRAEITTIAAAEATCSVQIITGGDSRMASVAAAIAALPATASQVLIHDAARPCISAQDITACLDALSRHPACLLARPCANTVKRVGPDGLVSQTVARDDLWLAETPQCAQATLAREAFARALHEGWQCTDDAEVFERAGHAVAVVPAGSANPKLTNADDRALIEALLARR